MKYTIRLFYTFAVAAVISVCLTALALAGMTFSDRQQRAFELLLMQARDLAAIMDGKEEGLVDENVLRRRLEFFGGDGRMRVWRVSAEGLVLDAVNPSGGPLGALDVAQAERYIRELPAEGLTVDGGFERFFDAPQATAIVPLSQGVLMLHRPMAALEQGDLMVIWRQAGLAGLAGAVAAALLIWLGASRVGGPVSRLAEQSRDLLNGTRQGLDSPGRGELSELADTLTSAVERSRESEEVRRGFMQNVSHELRSPLTSIQGYLQAVLDGAVPEGESAQYLGIALDEARRLSRVIEDIRALSRMESDAEAIEMRAFDVNEVIRRSLAAFAGRMEEAKVHAAFEFREETCSVMGNAALIRQAVDNLIDNAIKYAGTGGRVTVRTNRTRERVFVSIADDGPGIPKDDVPFLFERFYKVDKAHSGGGSGLGLAIVRSIIERHKQVIRISSREGRGTVAAFTLDPAEPT